MTARLVIGAAALTLLLGGCAAGPGRLPVAADVTLPPAFRFAPDAGAEADLAALMPTADPAYVALTAAAMRDSPTLAAALARIDLARARSSRADAERLPSIEGAVSGNRQRSSAATSNIPAIPGVGEPDLTRTQIGANLTALWDLDLFGQLRALQRAAVARVDAAGADAAAVRLALLSEIAASVTDWRTLAARDARLREDLESARALARLAASRAQAGLAPGLDRVSAEANVAASLRQLSTLDSDRARLLGRLVTLTAQPAASVEQSLALPHSPQAAASPPLALSSILLTNRPDVLAAGARLRAADGDVAAVAAARFPKFTLSSALGVLALGVGGLFDSDAVTGSLGANLAGPLLDFGRIAADIDRAEAATWEAFADYRGAVFTALGDAEAGYALVAAADREAADAATEATTSDRAAHLANVRFRAGLSDFAQVLNARRIALGAGERTAAARGRALRARISLWQALGGNSADAALMIQTQRAR